MNITDNRCICTCRFEKVAIGEVFEFNNKFYMATDIIEDECGHLYNTVNLHNGTMHKFNIHDIVNLVSVSLTVTNYNRT